MLEPESSRKFWKELVSSRRSQREPEDSRKSWSVPEGIKGFRGSERTSGLQEELDGTGKFQEGSECSRRSQRIP